MADTPNGETANPGASQTPVTTVVTPPAQSNAADPAEVERLRKQAEQAEMRARQLENEKAERDKRDAEAEQKRLEEQNEYKSLFEQEKAKREAFEKEREEAVAKIELEKSQAEVYKEFPDDVVELAKDTGLTLNESSEEAKEALKTKLNKLSERVSGKNAVTSNNGNETTNKPDRHALMEQHAKVQSITPGDTPVFHQALSELNWVKNAKAINGEA